jgi:membrane protease subunit HflC
MNRLIIAAVVVVAGLYVLFSSMFIVNAREQAIVTRFGEITRVISEPGLYFKIPTSVVDSVQIIEDRLLRYDLANLTVQVAGGKNYEVDAFLTYRIVDPRLFRQRAQGQLDVAEARIGPSFDNALHVVYNRREFGAALSEQRTDMMREVRDQLRGDAADLGIEIVDVRILRTDLTEQVYPQTFDRMKAERQAEAALLRARGQEAARTLRAIADRQAVEIVASARRDSEILRGEGDAQRNAVFATAYGADPEFFEFYRSMQSYLTALNNTGTTMVLSPDSEFFRYFQSGEAPEGTPAPVATERTPAPALAIEPAPTEAVDVTPPSPPEAVPEPVTPENTLVPATPAPAAAPEVTPAPAAAPVVTPAP